MKSTTLSIWVLASTTLLMSFCMRSGLAGTDPLHYANLAQKSASPNVLPSYFRASIWVKNGDRRCSGAIFLKGPKYAFGLSAAHCFQGRLRGKFVVGNIYGETCEATLLGHEPTNDLALWKMPTKYAHGVVCVPATIKGGVKFEKLGFTGGKGPVLADVRYLGRTAEPGTVCNECGQVHMTGLNFAVTDGRFGSGDSGGYVFAIPEGNPEQGMLTAIISAGEGDIQSGRGHSLTGPGLKEINQFINNHRTEFVQYGPYNIHGEYG